LPAFSGNGYRCLLPEPFTLLKKRTLDANSCKIVELVRIGFYVLKMSVLFSGNTSVESYGLHSMAPMTVLPIYNYTHFPRTFYLADFGPPNSVD
jgi:hypothetical protein